eukprot:13346006-Ditylum_brightwellii.AAC.1
MELNGKLIYRQEGGLGLNVLTLAWRLGVIPPSITRDLFLQQPSPTYQDIPQQGYLGSSMLTLGLTIKMQTM